MATDLFSHIQNLKAIVSRELAKIYRVRENLTPSEKEEFIEWYINVKKYFPAPYNPGISLKRVVDEEEVVEEPALVEQQVVESSEKEEEESSK